jgi:hypothetical protein
MSSELNDTQLIFKTGGTIITRLTGTNNTVTFAGAGGTGNVVLQGVDTPALGTDASNKDYVDNTGSWKTPVTVATVGVIDTTTDLQLGDSIDGVILGTKTRILVKNQGTGSQNGIYTPGTSVRANDMALGADVNSATVYVLQGDTQTDTVWVQTANVVVGDTQTWASFGASGVYTAGTGITISVGNEIAVSTAVVVITGNQNIDGVKSFINATESTNISSGAIIITGGLAVKKNIFVGGISNVAGIGAFTSSTTSTSVSTGAVVVTGGVGIGENIFVGGTSNVAGIGAFTSSTTSTSVSTGAVVVTGGVGISENIFVGGEAKFTLGTASSSTTTGTVIVTGGLGVSNNIFAAGTVNGSSFVTSSDIRLKKSIRPMQNSTTIVSKLQPVTYKWKDQRDNHIHGGVIAQATGKCIPEAVRTDSNGFLSVEYNTLFTYLLASHQELIERVKVLEQL